MLKYILSRLKKDPLDFIRRSLYKTIIESLKYGKGNDYDAARYWHDRFSKYGLSLKGAGVEGLSEEENRKMYAEAAKVFTDLCRKENVDFQSVNVLEIGPGTGFYAQILHDLGVKSYIGIDITDILFPELRKNFSQFRFTKKDITTEKIKGKFDLIIMINVIEHIVKESKLSLAMDNIKNCLSDNGIFIVSSIKNVSKRHIFYFRSWSLQDIKQRFHGYIFSEPVPFRTDHILVIKKNVED